MERVPAVPIREHFASLTDPRCANARHHLLDILVIAICAVLCGAEGWEDIEEYGHAQAEWCKQVLDMPHGIPSHDTFRRGLARLDPDEFTPCFLTWTQALSERSAGEIVAIDGKTLRRSVERAASRAAIPMVSAWANTNRLGLGQLKVDDKSKEITAMPQLLALLDLEGCIVTIDAMGCQKAIAHTITHQDADYVWALKEHHPTLYEDVTLFMPDAKAHNLGRVAYQCEETVEAEHGRLEIRTYGITSALEWLGAKASWSNVHSIGMVESHRAVGDHIAEETRYYLTSLPCEATQFAKAVREHWGVENARPWVLDVSFREDDCRIRKEQGAQNFAVLRHIALNLLQRESGHQRGIKARRKRAGWDRQYLIKVLVG